jgi:hypothetical protein
VIIERGASLIELETNATRCGLSTRFSLSGSLDPRSKSVGRRQAVLDAAVKQLGDSATGVQGDVSNPDG